jgi:HEAT repeat protein
MRFTRWSSPMRAFDERSFLMNRCSFFFSFCLFTLGVSSARGQVSASSSPATNKISTRQAVEDLANALRADDPKTKESAKSRLADPDSSANTALHDVYLKLLDDPNINVKEASMIACGKLHFTDAIPKIRQFLKSLPRHDVTSALHANTSIGDEYLHGVVAANALADLGDASSIPDILGRETLAVSWEAIIPKFGRMALPLLVEQARSTNPRKRSGALRSISALRDETAIPDLSVLLKDPDPKLRDSAVRALAHMKSTEALSAAEASYSTLDDWGKIDFVSSVCRQRGSSSAIQLGEDYIKKSHDAGRRADMLRAVSCTGDSGTIQFLEQMLNHPDDATRAEAACQLARWTGKAYPHKQTGFTKLLESRCEPLNKAR